MPNKWQRRENKIKSKKNRMPKHGLSLFTIEEITRKRAEKAKAETRRTHKNTKNDIAIGR